MEAREAPLSVLAEAAEAEAPAGETAPELAAEELEEEALGAAEELEEAEGVTVVVLAPPSL
jgi:hypothetical protein